MRNEKSLQLIKDFVNDYLDGDINKLVTFDIKQLQGNKKYGGCNGSSFDSDNTNIVRAVLAVVFENVWPDLDEDSITRMDYRGDTINTFNTMFGPRLKNGEFQGFSLVAPNDENAVRIEKFYHTYTTIGNFVILPNKRYGRYTLNTFRGTYSKWRDFFDKFLIGLRYYLTQANSDNEVFMRLMEANNDSFRCYRSEDGFRRLCKKLYLEDFLDNQSNVRHLFNVTYWWKKSLKTDEYIDNVCNYLDFCEPFIMNRGKMIVKILKEKLY